MTEICSFCEEQLSDLTNQTPSLGSLIPKNP